MTAPTDQAGGPHDGAGDPHDGAGDPHDWARSWLPSDDDPARPLMTLATLGLDGFPAARTVLLSSVSATGFRFHTDGRSAKAAELAADSRAALVITYPELARQLVVQGRAVRQSEADGALAYEHRSAYLRQLAWINDSEHAQLGDEERRRAWSDAIAQVPDGPLDPPASWAGYEIVPHRYLFWEGGADRASHRTEYVRSGDSWITTHLPG